MELYYMEIDLGPIVKYEQARSNAYWSRVGIDTRLLASSMNVSDYKNHLLDCEKNPTVGMIIRKKYITGKPMNYPEGARRNIKFIKQQPEIESLTKIIDEKIERLYPKTRHIREYIIDTGRVLLDEVKRKKEYTIFDKLAIFFRKAL